MTSTSHSTFDRETNASDVAEAFPESIKGRTILITGANPKGIGYTTAEAFASQSPRRLILAGRSAAKIQETIDSLKSRYPDIDYRTLLVDLGSQKSVKDAGNQILGWADVPEIHIGVNNAGIMRHGASSDNGIPKSQDGLEDMFATNHLGHWLLTNLIIPKIIAAAKKSPPFSVRVINISSSGTWVSPFRARDIAWEKPGSALPEKEQPNFAMLKQAGIPVSEETTYIPTAAYGQSKTCNVLFSGALNERLFRKSGILSLALNPGEIRTELRRYTDPVWIDNVVKKRQELGLLFMKTQQQGSSTTIVAACDPKLGLPESDGTGQYLDNCQIGKAPAWAVDKEAAEKLWQVSEGLTGQKFEW